MKFVNLFWRTKVWNRVLWTENFFDEDVLRIQNEVKQYKNEQRLHGGDVDDEI